MDFNDYYQLVKRYNPHKGWYAHRRDSYYARQFQLDNLSVSQTIIQLLQDAKNQSFYRSDKETVTAKQAILRPSWTVKTEDKPRVGFLLAFLLGVSVLSAVSWIVR